MNTLETTNTYADPAMMVTMYDTEEKRNSIFGVDQIVQSRALPHNAAADIRRAPKNYYDDMHTNPAEKTLIGPLDSRPTLYNDVLAPYTRNRFAPNTTKTWQPFTTSATPTYGGSPVWNQTSRCEIAPNMDERLWTPDLNEIIYRRKLVTSAQEQPYANFNRRQGLVELMAINMPPNNDFYTRKINSPDDRFCQYDRLPGTLR
jgi:hypothetical protein